MEPRNFSFAECQISKDGSRRHGFGSTKDVHGVSGVFDMDFSKTTNSRTSQNTIEPCLLKLDLQNTIMDPNIWKRDTDGNLWKLKDGSKRSLELGSTFDTESRFGIPRGTQISKLGFLETFQTLQNPILSLALERQRIMLKVRELDKF